MEEAFSLLACGQNRVTKCPFAYRQPVFVHLKALHDGPTILGGIFALVHVILVQDRTREKGPKCARDVNGDKLALAGNILLEFMLT